MNRTVQTALSTSVKSEPFPSHRHHITSCPGAHPVTQAPHHHGRLHKAAHHSGAAIRRAAAALDGHRPTRAPWRPPRVLWGRSSTGPRLCHPPLPLSGEPRSSAVTRSCSRALLRTDLVLLDCWNVSCFDGFLVPSGDGPIGSAGLFRRHAARRRISSFQPLCMGRRSCKIAGRKVMFSCHDLLHNFTLTKFGTAGCAYSGWQSRGNIPCNQSCCACDAIKQSNSSNENPIVTAILHLTPSA